MTAGSADAAGRPEVSLVIPVYNEEESLPQLAAEIRGAMRLLGRPYEVLFVDDGSDDGSLGVMVQLARQDRAIRVVRLARNCGQSAALDAGFRHARGAVVVTLDADLQNDPADIPRLLERLAGYDVVCGVRARRRDSWLRRVSSGIANAVRNRLTHESVADVGCTLKAFRADYLTRIPVWNGMHRFLPTLLRMEGARVTEVAVNHRPRRFGQPKYNIRNRLWRATADLFAVRWMQARWIDRRLAAEVEVWNPRGPARDPAAAPEEAGERPAELSDQILNHQGSQP
ncbi:MAG TPA: glycosyltransferase family 2 protein [Thermoanaerobaculia bacterium]|nr:glycosyltransferase family 2 protein [Thermoanaerobaculia bacterium]